MNASELEQPDQLWEARVLVAMGELARLRRRADRSAVQEMVAALFAADFAPTDRLHERSVPRWQNSTDEALVRLAARELVVQHGSSLELTPAGRQNLEPAVTRAAESGRPPRFESTVVARPQRDPIVAGVLTPPLRQKLADLDASSGRANTTIPVMIELNLRFGAGIAGAMAKVRRLWRFIGAIGEPLLVADEYAVGELTANQIEGIISADAAAGEWADRAIFRIWPDFEAHAMIDASAATIKALPAQRTFSSFGDGIVWAVIDSGIDATHPHFDGHQTLHHESVRRLHRDFTDEANRNKPTAALVDTLGHGTHVAGIIAGGLDKWDQLNSGGRVVATERRYNAGSPDDESIVQTRPVADPTRLAGMAPHARLVSLKVLAGGGDASTRVSRVIRALEYVRKVNSSNSRLPRIHGVNLSLGYEFDAEWFACGRSPLCLEVDRLVRSGVVVVAAAGNSGYVTLNPAMSDVTRFSAPMTINDPGNAELAITVGSTHRDSPHTNGISYFSSRGPTGDGRCKPDLVAPGERITSAAAGSYLHNVAGADEAGLGPNCAVYTERSGTSMAAPHVSGAIAAFLSVQREMIGKPEEIKRVFVDSATSLNRDRAFQGSGLLDLMRALSSV